MNEALPTSRPVAQLSRQIDRCHFRLERACLRAERAGLLARQGHVEPAGREIAALRTDFDPHPNPELSVGLFLAEAWTVYFSDLSPTARDKFQRAHGLSHAAGLTEQQALSAAWLAHMDYVGLDFVSMAKHVREALALAGPWAHAARSRACLVMADAYHLAQRLDLAQPWYARARQHALAEDDALTVSALNHNMAWHRALQALHATLQGQDAFNDARHALTSATATQHFDHYREVVSLPALIQVASALAHSVLGESAQALALYEAHAPQADAQGLRPMRALVLADMAWCSHQVGDAPLARHYAQAAGDAFVFSRHADDRALAHGRLAQVFRALGQAGQAKRHATQARLHGREHQALQERVLAAVEGITTSD
jgi:hypothetical protein